MPISHKLIRPHEASTDFECALMQLRAKAVDSRGLRIRLGPPLGKYSAKALFECLNDFITRYGPHPNYTYLKGTLTDGIAEDPDGELTFARNMLLLANAYVAAVEYERVAEPMNLRTPMPI